MDNVVGSCCNGHHIFKFFNNISFEIGFFIFKLFFLGVDMGVETFKIAMQTKKSKKSNQIIKMELN